MRSELLHNPTSGVVHVVFEQPREQLVARASALITRDTSIEARTTRSAGGASGAGGAGGAGGRDEDDPTTLFTATAPGQSLWLAPPAEGTVVAIAIARGAELFIQSSSWLARTPDVGLDTTWHGARTFFPRGATLARAWGEGELWYGTYGGLHVVEIGTTHAHYAAAADHVVAFTEGVQHRPRRADSEGRKARKGGEGGDLGLRQGEGWVDFSGAGRLWLQTRNPTALAGFLHPFRRVGGPSHPVR